MAKMDRDFFEFRKKVFSGNQKNKNAHIETVNVDELNDRYFNELTSNGTLIHAKSALYGMQHKNVAYYKREGTPGNYKYYYTEEEYRKAHSGDQASSSNNASSSNVKESMKQKYSKNPQNNEPSKTYVGENGNIYRQQADGSYKDSGTQWSELRKNTTAAADMKIEEAARNGGVKSAVSAIMKDERIKEMLDQFEGGFENNNWTLNYDGSISGMGQEDTDYFNKMNDWVKTFQKTSGVDIYNSKDYQDAVTQEIQKRWDKISKQKEHGKLYREGKTGNGEKKDDLNLDSVKNKNEEEEKQNESAKHSGLEGDRNMNINKVRTSSTGEEIMDVYRSFKEKANRGARMNQLSHSTIISANELNERYEEELLNQCILVHASNNYKYYNKIDLPNGGTRYFYTKAEWDAYNKEKGVQKLKNVLNKNKKAKGTPVAGAAQFITEAVDTVKTELDKQEKERKKKEDHENDIYYEDIKTTQKVSPGLNTAMQAIENVLDKLEDEWHAKLHDKETAKVNEKYYRKYKDYDDIVDEIVEEYGIKHTKDIVDNFGSAEKYYKEIEKRCQEEYDKQQKANEAAKNSEKDKELVEDIFDDMGHLTKLELRELSDIIGVDLNDDDAILKKYTGMTGDEWDELEDDPDDYGLSLYEAYAKLAQGLWKDYKAAKKQAGFSSKKK